MVGHQELNLLQHRLRWEKLVSEVLKISKKLLKSATAKLGQETLTGIW